ncbi:unnamed protein product, partial [Laminaria digitata]
GAGGRGPGGRGGNGRYGGGRSQARCQNCGELGHMHQYCGSRVDPDYPQPAGTAPRPRGTTSGGAPHPLHAAPAWQQPWPHSYGPEGSEVWVSDNGATNHITSDDRNVYDWIDYVLIGNGRGMRVKGVGSLNLKMLSKTDFDVKLTGVYATEGIGFNLFSLHDAQARQTITLDKDGVHLFDNRLT